MIDYLENQTTRRQMSAIMHHPPPTAQIHQHQQPVVAASATYHRPPLQIQCPPNLVDLPTSSQQKQQQPSSISQSNFQVRWEKSLDNSGDTTSNNNELIGYYFGSISRETADWILRNHGNQMDGAYLLRSSGPNDDFVLSLMVVTTMPNNSSISQQASNGATQAAAAALQLPAANPVSQHIEVLHYKIVETEDSFVALHGQVGDEKFATIDELIDKAQGVATKPRWPINRQSLESQILPPTYWGLSVYQVCLAFFIKAKQWGFPLLPSLFQPPQQQALSSATLVQQQASEGQQQTAHDGVTTLNIETMRTLIYKSLHEFQPWFHGKISREDAERRIEEGPMRDGKFLVRERDTYSYAMCICHRRVTKHYRIDVLPTGELAIQDGRKFTSLMALVSHYTIMSDGLWCALTEPAPRPIQPPPQSASATNNGFSDSANTFLAPIAIQQQQQQQQPLRSLQYASPGAQNLYCVPPPPPMPALLSGGNMSQQFGVSNMMAPSVINSHSHSHSLASDNSRLSSASSSVANNKSSLACTHPVATSVTAIKAPIKEWLQSINQKWSQLMAAKNQHQSLNSFLFGSQNPLNNHCRHHHGRNRHHHHHHQTNSQLNTTTGGERRTKSSTHGLKCGCGQQYQPAAQQVQQYPPPRNFDQPPNCCPQHKQSPHQHQDPRRPAGNRPLASQLLPLDQAALLNCLPQNSGFQLSGQSFVGSPLFAVRNTNNPNGGGTANKQTGTGSQAGSNSSGSNIVEEDEKLISPAQSISANLNLNQPQPQSAYNQNDIYGGSQPSTAIVDDKHLLTSSSSSSGTINQFNHGSNRFTHKFQKQQCLPPAANLTQRRPVLGGLALNGGHIRCGQHAGPAYRYTNCQNDENSSFGVCAHRPPQQSAYGGDSLRRPISTTRAFDDSLLQLETNQQLLGQAALSKFVQFQDGQCLRTHRDTRSIQMAYLSSRRTMQNNASNNNNNNSRPSDSLPFKAPNNLPAQTGNLQQQRQWSNRNNNQPHPGQQANTEGSEIDLMDCADSGGEHFRVDPKLIKSSSIETLCGAGDNGDFNGDDYDEDDEELDNVLNNCKSNAELLQACFKVKDLSRHATGNILQPIASNILVDAAADVASVHEASTFNQSGQLSSTLSVGAAKDNREKLDYLSKRHDLDELYTALFAELDASLKAQVDQKNKCLGFSNGRNANHHQAMEQMDRLSNRDENKERNASELIYEFDSLITSQRQ